MTQNSPPGTRLAEASMWGVRCGLAVAVVGFLGHLVGNRLYPQPSEQVPSDLLLVPFGFIAGFVTATIVKLANPQWGRAEMRVVLLLAAAVWAGYNFNYAEGRAIPPGLQVTFEPDPAGAVACQPASCPPGMDWTIEGHVRVQAIRIEGTVTRIRLTSFAPELKDPGPGFRGPTFELTGDEIVGERHLTHNDSVTYPLHYSYRTAGGGSARDVVVGVDLQDSRGDPVSAMRAWRVR